MQEPRCNGGVFLWLEVVAMTCIQVWLLIDVGDVEKIYQTFGQNLQQRNPCVSKRRDNANV